MGKETKAKSKALAKTGDKPAKERDLIWGGGQVLMGKAGNPKQEQERKLVNVVSTVMQITPIGLNILGGQPYVNNLGRKDKLDQYEKGASFEYNWVQRSVNDTDKAICEARIVRNGKPIKVGGIPMPWVSGECSPASMKMGTLSGYQNQMAQTRAENRAFQYAFGLRFHKDMLLNIKKLMLKTNDEKEQALLQQAATMNPSASAEEMQHTPASDGIETPTKIVLTNEEEAKLMKHISRLYSVDGLPANKRVLELEKIKKDFGTAKVKEKWNPNMLQYMVDLYKEVLEKNAANF